MKVEMEGENDPSLGGFVLGEGKVKSSNDGGKLNQQSGCTWACLCGSHKSVEIAERTGPMMYKSNGGPGKDKPGGVGRIVRRDPDGTFAVRYVLGGMESGIGAQFITCYVGTTCPRVREVPSSPPLTEHTTTRKDGGRGSTRTLAQKKRNKVGMKMISQFQGSTVELQTCKEEKVITSKQGGGKQQRDDKVALPVGESRQFGATSSLFKGGLDVPFGSHGNYWQQPSMFSSALVLGPQQYPAAAADVSDKLPLTSSVDIQRRETVVGLLLGAFQTTDCISRASLMTMVNAEAEPPYGEDELDSILRELDIENCILLCEGNIYPV